VSQMSIKKTSERRESGSGIRGRPARLANLLKVKGKTWETISVARKGPDL